MDCKKCGTPLEENDQFCKNCGAPVNQVSAQTNYGPAPKNGTLKFVLIFLGIAIIVAAVIISIAIFSGDKDKDDDDDRRNSKKKTEIITDEDEDDEIIDDEEDEDIIVEDEDEEEIIVKPTTKSTYTVKSNGFTFKIPTDLVYETMVEEGTETIVVGDEDQTWMATINPIQGLYNQILADKSQLQAAMIQDGYTASAAIEKTYAGVPFILIEASASGQNGLIAIGKANSMYIYYVVVMNMDNEFDYDALEEVAGILSTAEFNSETTNMKPIKGLDLSVISDLAKE